MAAAPTRMLLLGAVAIFEPVNGYQVRRELVSWRVDEWSSTNPGSIYHGLGRLAADGLLRRHDVDDGGRTTAVYETTEAGRAELHRLVLEGLSQFDPFDHPTFQAAFGFIRHLDDREVDAALRTRREGMVASLDDLAQPTPYAPPHAARGLALWRAQAEAELRWLDETLELLRAGALTQDWTPPDDDPGWQMQRDRERYRVMLGRGDASDQG